MTTGVFREEFTSNVGGQDLEDLVATAAFARTLPSVTTGRVGVITRATTVAPAMRCCTCNQLLRKQSAVATCTLPAVTDVCLKMVLRDWLVLRDWFAIASAGARVTEGPSR